MKPRNPGRAKAALLLSIALVSACSSGPRPSPPLRAQPVPQDPRPARLGPPTPTSQLLPRLDPHTCMRQRHLPPGPPPDDVQVRATFSDVAAQDGEHTAGFRLSVLQSVRGCDVVLHVWPGTLEPYRYVVKNASCDGAALHFEVSRELSLTSGTTFVDVTHVFDGEMTSRGLTGAFSPSLSSADGAAPRRDPEPLGVVWEAKAHIDAVDRCIDQRLAALPPLRRALAGLPDSRFGPVYSHRAYRLLCAETFDGAPGLVAVARANDPTVAARGRDAVGRAASWSEDYDDVERRGFPLVFCVLDAAAASGEHALTDDELASVLAPLAARWGDDRLPRAAAAWRQTTDASDPDAAVRRVTNAVGAAE